MITADQQAVAGERRRRRRALVAGLVPLLGLVAVWSAFAIAHGHGHDNTPEKLVWSTAYTGLGPVGAALVTSMLSTSAITGLFLVAWGSYIAAILLTRLGLIPWGLHLLCSGLWCGAGLIMVPYAALAVT